MLLGALQLPSISPNISEIEHQVGGNQHGIEHVEPDHDVVTVQCLVDDAEDVAQDDERHKNRTFADHDFGAQRFGDGQWPADRETEQEQDFPDAEMWHVISFFGDSSLWTKPWFSQNYRLISEPRNPAAKVR